MKIEILSKKEQLARTKLEKLYKERKPKMARLNRQTVQAVFRGLLEDMGEEETNGFDKEGFCLDYSRAYGWRVEEYGMRDGRMTLLNLPFGDRIKSTKAFVDAMDFAARVARYQNNKRKQEVRKDFLYA